MRGVWIEKLKKFFDENGFKKLVWKYVYVVIRIRTLYWEQNFTVLMNCLYNSFDNVCQKSNLNIFYYFFLIRAARGVEVERPSGFRDWNLYAKNSIMKLKIRLIFVNCVMIKNFKKIFRFPLVILIIKVRFEISRIRAFPW